MKHTSKVFYNAGKPKMNISVPVPATKKPSVHVPVPKKSLKQQIKAKMLVIMILDEDAESSIDLVLKFCDQKDTIIKNLRNEIINLKNEKI